MNVTDKAFGRIQKILDDDSNDVNVGTHLRVYVEGGGCSGFQYGFKLTRDINEDDFIVEKDNMKVLVDTLSYQYLNEATLDYKSSLEGDMFIITNPAATTTCGCGSSFAA